MSSSNNKSQIETTVRRTVRCRWLECRHVDDKQWKKKEEKTSESPLLPNESAVKNVGTDEWKKNGISVNHQDNTHAHTGVQLTYDVFVWLFWNCIHVTIDRFSSSFTPPCHALLNSSIDEFFFHCQMFVRPLLLSKVIPNPNSLKPTTTDPKFVRSADQPATTPLACPSSRHFGFSYCCPESDQLTSHTQSVHFGFIQRRGDSLDCTPNSSWKSHLKASGREMWVHTQSRLSFWILFMLFLHSASATKRSWKLFHFVLIRQIDFCEMEGREGGRKERWVDCWLVSWLSEWMKEWSSETAGAETKSTKAE